MGHFATLPLAHLDFSPCEIGTSTYYDVFHSPTRILLPSLRLTDGTGTPCSYRVYNSLTHYQMPQIISSFIKLNVYKKILEGKISIKVFTIICYALK